MKLIDIHTHGISGVDTAEASEHQILTIAELQGQAGVSEIIPAVYPSSLAAMRKQMQAIQKAMDIQRSGSRSQDAEMKSSTSAAKIIGMHLEGPFLNSVQCGALDAGSFLEADEKTFKELIEGFEKEVKIITIAPELERATSLIRLISDMGIIASMGHSDATYAEAENGFHAGARGITHIFNAMRGIHHREPGISGFGLMNQEVYTEVIADPFHLDKRMIDLIFTLKSPEKIIIISDTVKTSKMTPSTDGIQNEYNKLIGGSLTIKEASEHLIQMGLNKEIVQKAISQNPEQYLDV